MSLDKGILLIIVLFFWINLLVWMKRKKLNFFAFLLGSLGFFSISMVFFLAPIENGISNMITKILEGVGKLTHLFTVYPNYSILSIETKNGIVSMLINYECSGVIEILIYLSLVVFFPFIEGYKKVLAGVLGTAFIVLANIFRIMSIAITVNLLGIYSYAFAHTILGRIIFFGCMVILYYYVFTKVQIQKQKVGEIR